MRIPNGEDALVDIDKLTHYCLSEYHPHGKHKARVFRSVLGLTHANAKELRGWLQLAARTGHARAGIADAYGARYIIDFEIIRQDRRAIVRSAWIIETDDSAPRFVTCFIL